MSTATAADDITRATRHARLRWVGVPLFWLGALGLLTALGGWLTGRSGFGPVALYMAATGLSLGSFGVNNDTALALALRPPAESLPAPLRAELQDELRSDRRAVTGLVPAPVAGQVVVLIALTLHALAATVLLRKL